MSLVIIIIMATLVFGVVVGTIAHVDGSSRVPPRPRRKTSTKTYIWYKDNRIILWRIRKMYFAFKGKYISVIEVTSSIIDGFIDLDRMLCFYP